MKLKNLEIFNIFKCVNELIDCKEAKIADPDSGKTIYAAIKTKNMVTPIINALGKKETELRLAVSSVIAEKPDAEKELNIQFGKDMAALMDEESDVLVHKISKNSFEIVQKYLSGASTTTLLNFLTLDE